ncbi:protein-disulfide reductase DsbD [Aestuariicella hydrocarbonica]|uniref:Protein-disulfide reductase DsbD n=1 Tax=Pseudomaricurvus hydrocarbonicus TaxID=1470433 RepID=A0A9E5T269_9GAMM|nr:protein-disulfide reductase DsbD [Aestuariicella hydrocarbonica]NHO68175.1 protein-disulfide reductase DsbD [Aestuariicella hydrocarbonica]
MPPKLTSLTTLTLFILSLWSSAGLAVQEQAPLDSNSVASVPQLSGGPSTPLPNRDQFAFEPSTSSSANPVSLNPTSLDSSLSVSFLPVNQAYQLSGTLHNQQLLIHWDIADGYYLYQHKLKFVLNGNPQTVDLPTGIEKYDDYFEQQLEVYYNTLDITLALPELSVAQSLDIIVHSQGCADAGLCYPPQQQTLRLEQGNVTLIQSPQPTAPPDQAVLPTSPSSVSKIFLAAFGALLGGMLLNLMPCVFPVLSLKALSLARSRENPHQQHWHGWAYTAGVIATFVLIAAIMLSLRQAGQAIGWGFQLQSPVIVALLAYLFFAMGLALSGLLNLGSSLSGSGQALTEGHRYRSSFFTGALATVVASPCTAPMMGGALGFAVTQPTFIALTIFVSLGFGMALPFLLLTYFPSLSQKLPKPGQWMETLKQLLAFPLYFTALWLLWVVSRQTDSDTLVALVAGAIGLAFAAWLWQHQPARRWQKVIALMVVCSAVWPVTQIEGKTQAASASTARLENNWQPYTQARLTQLLNQGTPTFVNLTADWCITCLANEKIALDTEKTLIAFEDAGIVKLKGDWTHYNPEITHLLSQFDRNGVPLYLLYSGNPNDPPVILPQLLREQTIISAIDRLKASR